MNNNPVFVIGNPRSGTTLLRLMLTCHPNIIIPPEGGFAVHLYEKYKNFNGFNHSLHEFSEDVVNCRKLDEWNISIEGLNEYIKSSKPKEYAEMVNSVYNYFSLINEQKVLRWGDKNNYYLHHIPTIKKIFPNAKFIHIIRDGRDVACSYRDLSNIKGKYAPKLPTSINDIAKEWSNNINKIFSAKKYNHDQFFYELRYEDLVSTPETELRKICIFINEPYSEEMLFFYKKNKEKGLEPATYDQWKQRNKEKLDATKVGRWVKELNKDEIICFETIAGEILNRYNYKIYSEI